MRSRSAAFVERGGRRTDLPLSLDNRARRRGRRSGAKIVGDPLCEPGPLGIPVVVPRNETTPTAVNAGQRAESVALELENPVGIVEGLLLLDWSDWRYLGRHSVSPSKRIDAYGDGAR